MPANPPAFEKQPVLAILRGITEASLKGVMEALINAGLRHVEITLNTPNASCLIEKALNEYSRSLCIGAGTVLSRQEAVEAVERGAQFLVAPTLNVEVAAFCREQGVAYFPGGLTPTEIQNAWSAGARMVKVFPAAQVGPDYFRLVRGPFPEIPLMAVGGVTAGNVLDYLGAGASAVALGGSIISPSRMESQEFPAIQKEVREFLFAVDQFSPKINVKSTG